MRDADILRNPSVCLRILALSRVSAVRVPAFPDMQLRTRLLRLPGLLQAESSAWGHGCWAVRASCVRVWRGRPPSSHDLSNHSQMSSSLTVHLSGWKKSSPSAWLSLTASGRRVLLSPTPCVPTTANYSPFPNKCVLLPLGFGHAVPSARNTLFLPLLIL